MEGWNATIALGQILDKCVDNTNYNHYNKKNV